MGLHGFDSSSSTETARPVAATVKAKPVKAPIQKFNSLPQITFADELHPSLVAHIDTVTRLSNSAADAEAAYERNKTAANLRTVKNRQARVNAATHRLGVVYSRLGITTTDPGGTDVSGVVN